jgi:SAM-dependent methyltransferase
MANPEPTLTFSPVTTATETTETTEAPRDFSQKRFGGMTESSHWAMHARRWQHIGFPLRPSPADLQQVLRAFGRHFVGAPVSAKPARALLFGVTPELARLELGFPADLTAFDESPAMIAAVWPGDTSTRRARVGDWCALDLPNASIDLALGDGCLSMLPYPEGYRRLADSLARVLAPGGLFSIRLFCRPEPAESVEHVFAELFAGHVGNFHVFKWRLAMALQGDSVQVGVNLDSIWRAFQAHTGGAQVLAERLAWPLDEVSTIDNYRGSTSSYTYATAAEVVSQFATDFALIEEWRGSYELAERCPQLLFRRV